MYNIITIRTQRCDWCGHNKSYRLKSDDNIIHKLHYHSIHVWLYVQFQYGKYNIILLINNYYNNPRTIVCTIYTRTQLL